jgi:hypothetical protein
MSRVLALLASAALAPLAAACGPPAEAFCGLSSEPPTLEAAPEGRARATFDGDAFDEEATYSVGPAASFVAGVLTIDIVADTTGTKVDELIGRGAFPICVELGARSETTMAANYVSDGATTSADKTGALSILDADGDVIVGRFQVELGGAATHSVTDGVFRATKR